MGSELFLRICLRAPQKLWKKQNQNHVWYINPMWKHSLGSILTSLDDLYALQTSFSKIIASVTLTKGKGTLKQKIKGSLKRSSGKWFRRNFERNLKRNFKSNVKTTSERNLKGSLKTQSKTPINGIKKESERNLQEEPNRNLKGKAT